MRILFVTPLDYERRPNNREHHLVRHCRARGWEVTVLSKAGHQSRAPRDLLSDALSFRVEERCVGGTRLVRLDPLFNYFGGLGVSLAQEAIGGGWRAVARARLASVLAPLALSRDVGYLIGARRAASRLGPHDLCVGFGPWGAAVGAALRRRGQVAALVYEDRDYEPGLCGDRVRSWVTARVERRLVRRADLVLSVGRRLAELRRRQGARRVEWVPTGVEALAPPPAPVARRPPALVYAGNLAPWSGLEVAIRALPAIRRRAPGARLLLAGDGTEAYVARLRREASSLADPTAVEFLGPRPHAEIPALLAGADVGLALFHPTPYRVYAAPLKVVEYAAAGLSVIGTVGTETGDAVTEAGCGLAIPCDEQALAEAAGGLLVDRGRRRSLGEAGRRWSAGRLWKRILERECALWEEALAGRGAAAIAAGGGSCTMGSIFKNA